MSKPEIFTARQLIEVLKQFGDMVIGVAIVDADNTQTGAYIHIRPEVNLATDGGEKVLSLTGYEESA